MNCIIDAEYVNTVIVRRKRDIHKGDCGKVLVIAGSRGMAGAAVLCGRGVLRAGAGLARICVPELLFPIIQSGVPEATCIDRDVFANSRDISQQLSQYAAVAVGPGLGEDKKNEGLILQLLESYAGCMVLDADGLNLLAARGHTRRIRDAAGKVIITPHIGEAARLLDISTTEALNMDRVLLASELCGRTGAITVLKGAGTIVASENEEAYINTTGNPGMATGGSGDVLTGVIAGLAAQGIEPLPAARAGVYIHGLAGDIAAWRFSEYGVLAGDIAQAIAFAIKKTLEDGACDKRDSVI